MKIKTVKALNLLLLFLVFSACKNEQKDQNTVSAQSQELVELRHATNFNISDFGDYYILKVETPWPDAEKAFKYLLTRENAEIPSNLEYDQKVQIPIEKMVVTSTTHIPALETLNEEKSLIGFPGLDYISSVKTRKLINSGEIKELGKNENINTEVLIDLDPEVVIGFAIDGNNKTFETIQKIGIPVMYNGDWTEKTPLGKAEWIKFFGVFYDKLEEAEKIFNEIETDYNEAKELAKSAEKSPKVLSGAMYKDQWYLPYGNSWHAQFIKDANANYVYAQTQGNGSMALSFESVLAKAQDAEFWISAGQYTSYTQLLEESQHYQQFEAVENKKVYSVSLTKGETGGVLYFELGPQRPDLVLKDLVSIFHPNLIPEYENRFFKALEE
ncbi:ABC transporter substrate-binding protein [Salegentibacter salegens]|uniref:Iron complex transport system substrate-binding protein n=1 Tax=Salegentibacter salegens TaxID=143223 RepID=A0A1M7JE46_9FLAO|nr:ABC transporter substrate-binding protein [Salegentibacter salegens]PRX42824.1 iron complex transport system substrate-binding protein [Salegentibacter salegens]SHM51248.1 iron complex transport system substrate-binding protein [Salegentibacter salegens]